MKRKPTIFALAIVADLFVLSSCASLNTPSQFPDDVYGRAAVAKELPENHYRSQERYNEEAYADSDDYQESYVDGYQDGYYASRINRFYYFTPGMTYYDPFFDPWMGYGFSPYGYTGYSFGLSFGWRGWGWGSPYYSPFNYYYGGWGPYSYYDRYGYGFGGSYGWLGSYYPYYPVAQSRPVRTRPGNLGTDNIRNRSTRPSRGMVSSANGDRTVRPTATRPSRGVTSGSATRPTQTRPTQTRPTQTRPTQTRPTQTRPTQTRPTQTRPTQTRPTQTRPTQTRPTQTRPTQTRPTQTRPTQTRPTQTRPAQTRPTQSAPTQVRPTQTRPTQSSSGTARSTRSRG